MPRPRTRLSIELLETLVTLMDAEGDASIAQKKLGINQPSMSKRLALLQNRSDATGPPWLTRTGKRWELTVSGRELLPAVRELVHRRRLLETAIDNQSPVVGHVWLCCGEEAVRSFVRPAILEFLQTCTDTTFRVSVLSPPARIAAVVHGAADLATVTHDDENIRKIAGRPLHIEELTADPLMAVIGKRCPSTLRKRFEQLPAQGVSLQSLADFPLILPAPEGGTRVRIDTAFAVAEVSSQLQIVAELEGWQTLIDYAHEGVGVAILPTSALEPHGERLIAKAIDIAMLPATKTKLICRYRADSANVLDLSSGAESMRQLLVKHAAAG